MTAATRGGSAFGSPRGSRAGFTLIELLAVVAFIGIVAAASAPSFIELTRDNRVDAASLSIADIYRTARSRAMGRGSATVVRWDLNAAMPTAATPYVAHFVVREAILGANGLAGSSTTLPQASCFTPAWDNNSTTSKYVMNFDERNKLYEPAAASFLDPTNSAQPYAEICFTPHGRTYVRYANAGAFAVLAGVPRIQVQNTHTLLNRFVVFPPSGSARVVANL